MSRSTSEISMRLVQSNMFKPSSNFLTDPSKGVLFCGSILCFVFVFVIVVCMFLAVMSLLCVMFYRVLSLSLMVSWVRYGT